MTEDEMQKAVERAKEWRDWTAWRMSDRTGDAPRPPEQSHEEGLSQIANALIAMQERCFAVAEALQSLRNVVAGSSRDWSTHRGDAWIWGVLWGWGALKPGDMDVLDEMARAHNWSDKDRDRLRRMSLAVAAIVAALSTKPSGGEG